MIQQRLPARQAMDSRKVTNRRFPDDARIVALTVPFGLDTIPAERAFFTTLDPALAARQTARLGALAHVLLGLSQPRCACNGDGAGHGRVHLRVGGVDRVAIKVVSGLPLDSV